MTCLARPDTSDEYCTVELLSREVFTAIPEKNRAKGVITSAQNHETELNL